MLPILTLQRHEQAVHSLAVWNDSVFTGSEDMEIKVGLLPDLWRPPSKGVAIEISLSLSSLFAFFSHDIFSHFSLQVFRHFKL